VTSIVATPAVVHPSYPHPPYLNVHTLATGVSTLYPVVTKSEDYCLVQIPRKFSYIFYQYTYIPLVLQHLVMYI